MKIYKLAIEYGNGSKAETFYTKYSRAFELAQNQIETEKKYQPKSVAIWSMKATLEGDFYIENLEYSWS